MKSIERRLAVIEEKEFHSQTDFASLSDEELDARILGQLTEWCRSGATLEEIGRALMGFGCDDIAENTVVDFIWDPETQTVSRNPGRKERSHRRRSTLSPTTGGLER